MTTKTLSKKTAKTGAVNGQRRTKTIYRDAKTGKFVEQFNRSVEHAWKTIHESRNKKKAR